MMEDMESMWLSMKGSHYQRIMDQLHASIHKTRNLDEALRAALESVAHAIHAESGTVWFYDRAGTGRIHPRAVTNSGALDGVSLAPGEGIAGQVIESSRSVIIKDCQADPRWAGRVDHATGFTTKSMICVPLLLGECCFGSIQIINNQKGVLFDDKDLDFTEHLAKEIVLLFKGKGLLDDYPVDEPEEVEPELTFRELFLEGSASETERLLYGMTEFASLSHRDQREVLKLCKQLRVCFTKRRT